MAMMKYSSSTSVNQINKSSQWGKVKSASLRDEEEEKKLKELQKNSSK
jgi:hypothetical protein